MINLIIGSIIGIFIMCLLQINRDNELQNRTKQKSCIIDELREWLEIAIHNSWYLYKLNTVNQYEDGIRAKVYENVLSKLNELGGDVDD